MELSFSNRVTGKFIGHFKSYLLQYVVDEKAARGEDVSQDTPGSCFRPASMAFI